MGRTRTGGALPLQVGGQVASCGDERCSHQDLDLDYQKLRIKPEGKETIGSALTRDTVILGGLGMFSYNENKYPCRQQTL